MDQTAESLATAFLALVAAADTNSTSDGVNETSPETSTESSDNYEKPVWEDVKQYCQLPADVEAFRFSCSPCHLPEAGSTVSPDRDSRRTIALHAPVAPIRFFRNSRRHSCMKFHGYSFNGHNTVNATYTALDLDQIDAEKDEADVNVYEFTGRLGIFSRTRAWVALVDWLEMAPDLKFQVWGKIHPGLQTRMVRPNSPSEGVQRSTAKACKLPQYDIWFLIPTVTVKVQLAIVDQLTPCPSRIAPVAVSDDSEFSEDGALFYMKWDPESGKIRIFCFLEEIDRIYTTCAAAKDLDLQSDPFTFLNCVFTHLLVTAAMKEGVTSKGELRNANAALELSHGMSTEQEGKAKSQLVDMRKKLSLQLQRCDYMVCLSRTIKQAIEEHARVQKIFEVPTHVYDRVHSGLLSALNFSDMLKAKAETHKTLWENAIFTLSDHLNVKNFRAINAHTNSLSTLAELGRQDNATMAEMSRAARTDSEAMKVIAVMTMVYLPASFVATLFSMGIFRFGFSDDKDNKSLVLSSQWWLYIAVALPLTLANLAVFRFLSKRSMLLGTRKGQDEPK